MLAKTAGIRRWLVFGATLCLDIGCISHIICVCMYVYVYMMDHIYIERESNFQIDCIDIYGALSLF